MNRVIILEGPDGAGKTTLANVLADLFDAKIIHEGPPPHDCNRFDYYTGKIHNALHSETNCIFDRCHLGEFTYAPVMRSENTMTYNELHVIQRLCDDNHIPIIICLPPVYVCYENYRARRDQGKEYVDDDNKFFDIYWRFKALSAYSFSYDYTRDSLENLLSKIGEAK